MGIMVGGGFGSCFNNKGFNKVSVHFLSTRLDWKTPKAVYQILDAEFRFDHDPCPPNYKINGLTSDWGGCNYVNPPYGRELPKW